MTDTTHVLATAHELARPGTQQKTNHQKLALSLPEDKQATSAVKQTALSAWDQVQIARHKDRPHTVDYIGLLGSNFFEMRGDRSFADDPAVMGGLMTFANRPVMIIGHQKGRSTKQRQECKSGMPHPEGYRKAQRLMRHAEKFGFPIICLIDTPGAFPGFDAEERGQAQAIAETIALMADLQVPTISVVIGEGGSGGALAFGLTDAVLMLEHSIYTVASPEAAATIIWRDTTQAALAASSLRITAPDLLAMHLIDDIISEPEGGAHLDYKTSGAFLSAGLQQTLAKLANIPISTLLEHRYRKFRHFDHFILS
jgi:acetyl-CoA carboxylase carboxyl transferase subunit alpha